jgi:hypothetical protein
MTPVPPTPKFACVANGTSNNVSAYTINASTGALTVVTGSPGAAGTGPYRVITAGTIRQEIEDLRPSTHGVGGLRQP